MPSVNSNARPHPGPLPPEEGGLFSDFRQNQALDLLNALWKIPGGTMAVPSPGWEGQGEGGRVGDLNKLFQHTSHPVARNFPRLTSTARTTYRARRLCLRCA